jgi:lysophospholipase L1-like esterase
MLAFAMSAGAAEAAALADCPPGHAAFSDAGRWTALRTHGSRAHILAIGSSSTAGIGASDKEHTYPAQLAAFLAGRGFAVAVDNAGVSGETADATIGRLERAIAEGDYDLVIWQVGTNDAVRGADMAAVRGQVLRGIVAAAKAGVRLLLLDQQFYPGIKDSDRYESFVRTVDDLGADNHVAVFSRYAMMKAWSASEGLLAGMLSPDQFHMNDRGYGCVAARLGAEIARVLPAPRQVPAIAAVAVPTK